ncbi:Do family serine endopeptidase [Acidobacteria bacterium AB60]|nr:Do family serine endopeptidase [Acidobacteria bacterium AB60]
MTQPTNHLVGITRKLAAPAAIAGAFALGAAMFAGHGGVHAAAAAGMPLDDNSVSALTSLDHAMEAVASKVTPAVVNVAVTSRVNPADMSDPQGDEEDDNGGPSNGHGRMQQLPPGLRQFFGPGFQFQQPQGPQIEHGIGSGIIVSPDGYIVTNNHVVDGATQVRVTLNDRRVFSAKVVGTDKLTDLAVIKINASDLPTIAWGDSTRLQPGQTVLAFGSPFGYFQFSVTRGIVSAVDRPNPYRDDARKPGGFIQTDAAINPGNSGGPLVDARGELVGINTFIISSSGSFQGAGFAIPSKLVKATTDQIIKNGHVDHGYLGVNIEDVTPENAHFFNLNDASGAIISQVTPDSPASKGGLHQGDVVREANGQKIPNSSSLQLEVSEMTPGSPLKLEVMRDGKPMTVNLTVGQFRAKSEMASNDSGGSHQKGKIGVAVANLDDQARQQFNVPDSVKGVVVQQVRPGSPADDAGLQPGDVIEEVNRKPAGDASQFAGTVHAAPADKDLLLTIWSRGNSTYRTVHPDQSLAQSDNNQ